MDNKIYDFQKNLRKWIDSVKAVCFDIGSSPILLSTLMKKALALQSKKSERDKRIFY
jgi:hypothetical protein